MDPVTDYGKLIERRLSELAELSNHRPQPGVETVCAFDAARGQYLLLTVGWEEDERVCTTSLYVRLRGGKVWIEDDWTEDGIATYLVAAGVPKQDIILGFQPPNMRKLTEFA